MKMPERAASYGRRIRRTADEWTKIAPDSNMRFGGATVRYRCLLIKKMGLFFDNVIFFHEF